MVQHQRRISDLTVEEFKSLLREMIQDILHEEQGIPAEAHPQVGLLDLEPVRVGAWTTGLNPISREEYYDMDQSTEWSDT